MEITLGLIEGLVARLRPCSVAVIGDVMLDCYVRGSARRLSPEGPIPILEAKGVRRLPGGAANVALQVVGLGCDVRLVGLRGIDSAGERLEAFLANTNGITSDLVRDPDRPTTTKTRFLAGGQQLLRVDQERRTPPGSSIRNILEGCAWKAASSSDVVILEDYGKGVLSRSVIRGAMAGATARSAIVVVDPCGTRLNRFAGATVLTPNQREAEVATGKVITNKLSLDVVGAALVRQAKGSAIAITRGPEGISFFRNDSNGVICSTEIPTVRVPARDVTGAGDAVTACMAVALASGLDLLEASVLANFAGLTVVRQLGVGSLSIERMLIDAARALEPMVRRQVLIRELPRRVSASM